MKHQGYYGVLSSLVCLGLSFASPFGCGVSPISGSGGGVLETNSTLRTVTGHFDGTQTSCGGETGAVTVQAIDNLGNVVEGTVGLDGSFSLELQEDRFYHFEFIQSTDDECGNVVYDSGHVLRGQPIIIGQSDDDIELGSVTDLGNGFYQVELTDDVDAIDSDGDGIADISDDDDDGDGVLDVDSNHNGLLDYAEEGVSGSLNSCDVYESFPVNSGPLFLNDDGDAVVSLTFNETFLYDDIISNNIRVEDGDGDIILSGFPLDAFEGEANGFELNLGSSDTFEPGTSYTLVIGANTVTCTNDDANDSGIEIYFTVIDD